MAATTYKYVAISPSGERREGRMRAPSPGAVQSVLEADGFQAGPISAVATNPMSQIVETVKNAQSEGGPKVKVGDLATVVKQLEVLMRSGLTPGMAVENSLDACPSKKLRGVMEEVVERVRQGENLADAFAHYPRTFGESFIAYVASAEQSGTLPETFGQLYEQLSQSAFIEAEISSAVAYPKYAGGIALMIGLGMIQFLLPQFAQIFESMGGELPAITQLLITIKNKMGYVVGGLVLAVAGTLVWLDQTRGNIDVGEKIDKVKFRVPIFGSLLLQQALFRWCATMAGLQRSAVHVDVALGIAARASGSRWMMKLTPHVVDSIRDGEDMSSAIRNYPFVPQMILALSATGEKTGELAETLDAAAAAIAQQVNARIGALGKKIETLTLVLVMGVMGFIIAGLWLPILTMSAQASEGFK